MQSAGKIFATAAKGCDSRPPPNAAPQHLGYGGFCAVPSPYMRNTRAAAPSDFAVKSEGAAALVGRWYGGGGGDGAEEGGERAFVATQRAASLQRPWGLHLRSVRYAHGEAVGGGIFALRRPRPYSRAWAGRAFGSFAAVLFQDAGGIWITTRRVATSSEKRENRF